jgi:G3E family GTPase
MSTHSSPHVQLSHILNNNQGLRIAVVVNDMASVNIDSKLVNRMNTAAGMVELQNGCACCSKSEELLSSVGKSGLVEYIFARSSSLWERNSHCRQFTQLADLVTLNDMRAEDQSFDHIVVELSGVADPVSVRNKFQECAWYNMPLLERVRLDTMVTLVDCSTFTDYLQSTNTANPVEAPQLFYREGESPPDEYDGISTSLLAKMGISMSTESDSGVAALIVSQTETADVVILNKIDLIDDGSSTLDEIQDIVSALNPRARVLRTTFGVVALNEVIGVARGLGVVQAGIIDDHKDAVHAVTCNDPSCTDPSHTHQHHSHESALLTETVSHSHALQHTLDAPCADADCLDTSHSHNHAHVIAASSCDDPSCTDPTHSHDSVGQTHAGIGSFVYRARRPFHPERLIAFLRRLNVKRGLPADSTMLEVSKDAKFHILRSKGFAWCANSDVSALYWSHAGVSFDMSCLGSWWATLPQNQWPVEAVDTILQDFDSSAHEESNSEFTSVGDRRQEIVFIGPNLSGASKQAEITEILDACLLNEAEWQKYVQGRSSEDELESAFPSPIRTQPVG